MSANLRCEARINRREAKAVQSALHGHNTYCKASYYFAEHFARFSRHSLNVMQNFRSDTTNLKFTWASMVRAID